MTLLFVQAVVLWFESISSASVAAVTRGVSSDFQPGHAYSLFQRHTHPRQ
jgi:hypothetical protein